MKDKTTAAILAFFLGGLGAHKFYLGKKATNNSNEIPMKTYVLNFIFN